MALSVAAFGPFSKGVVDGGNPSLRLQGAMRSCTNAIMTGIQRLSVRPGAQLAITLKDDAGTPATVTSVRAITPFADGCLAVGYSSATEKCYLYRLDASLTGYYDTSGTFTASATAAPIKVLWSSMSAIPDVQIAEGLGTAYIAHTAASDASGLYWPTKAYTDFNTLASLAASGTDGSSVGSDTAYFNGVVSFQQALWGFGYGTGSTAGTAYRPEMLRFSPPSFGNLQTADSLTVGDRVRSQRERIVGAGVAGDALIVGASNFVSRITGAGRDSWYKVPVDRSYGFVGPKAFCTAGDTLYYYSRRGPMRITQGGPPEPLWDALPETVNRIVNTSRLMLAFDPDRDQVLYCYDTGTGVNTFAAFDTRRDIWLGPDSALGIVVACAGTVEPYTASTATPPTGPLGPPTTPSTTLVGQTTATANWVAGDPGAVTEVLIGTQASGTFTAFVQLPAGVESYTFTGLTSGVDYQWRAHHTRYGAASSELGPTADTQFTTTTTPTTLQPPNSLTAVARSPYKIVDLYWTNSGESGVSTEIHRSADNVTYSAVQTVANGVASASVTVADYGRFYFKVRHVLSTLTSDFTDEADDTVTPFA